MDIDSAKTLAFFNKFFFYLPKIDYGNRRFFHGMIWREHRVAPPFFAFYLEKHGLPAGIWGNEKIKNKFIF